MNIFFHQRGMSVVFTSRRVESDGEASYLRGDTWLRTSQVKKLEGGEEALEVYDAENKVEFVAERVLR